MPNQEEQGTLKEQIREILEINSSPIVDEEVINIIETLMEDEGLDIDSYNQITVTDVFFAPNGISVSFDEEEYYVIPEGEEEEAAIAYLLNNEEEFLYTLNPSFLETHIEEEDVIDLYLDDYTGSFSEEGEDEDTAEDRAKEYLEEELSEGVLKFFKNLGLAKKGLSGFLLENGLVDTREVAEDAVSIDGVGHFLSGHDGAERRLGDMSYYYYRWN